MIRLPRYLTSLLMTVVYLLLTLSPLVSIGIHSQPFLQVLSRECSGDCRLCDCSAERSASRSCCCWQKKLAEAKKQRAKRNASCSLDTSAPIKTAGSCCDKHSQQEDDDHEAVVASPQAGNSPDNDSDTVGISTCPCGSDKDLAFSGSEKSQHIPFRYSGGMLLTQVTCFSFLQPELLISRYREPPDPPPKVPAVS